MNILIGRVLLWSDLSIWEYKSSRIITISPPKDAAFSVPSLQENQGVMFQVDLPELEMFEELEEALIIIGE